MGLRNYSVCIVAGVLALLLITQDWRKQPAAVSKMNQPITIVTAFYNFNNRSKHNPEEYKRWLGNFLARIQTPLFIYSDVNSSQALSEMRAGLPTTIVIYPVFDLPPMQNVSEAVKKQHGVDPEKFRHYPELYFVWSSKVWMVKNAADENPYGSDYFFWVDAGSFRQNHSLQHWPSVERVDQVFQGHEELLLLAKPSKAVFQEHQEQWLRNGTGYRTNVIQGGFFGGKVTAVNWFNQHYYTIFYSWLSLGRFAGKEQNLFNIIAFENPRKIMYIDPEAGTCGNGWFFFQQFLASPRELNRGCPQPLPTLPS
jgi:hypothetical protein